jgi:hypothetical protein
LKDDRSTASLEAFRTRSISSLAASVSSLADAHKYFVASYGRKVDWKVIAELREKNIKFMPDFGEVEAATALQLELKERLKQKKSSIIYLNSASSPPAESEVAIH